MATKLQGSLQSMQDGEIGAVLAALASMQGQSVCSSNRLSDCATNNAVQQTNSEVMMSMYLRQNEMYEVHVLNRPTLQPRLTVLQRVQDLDHSFAILESKAETLHEAQTRQAEMQARLHNQTQVEMQASRSLIANVTSSTRGLHEAVDDAAAKIAKLAWFGAVPGDLINLAWLALAVTVLHWYSPTHAKFVATIIGGFPKTIETSMLIGSYRNYDIRIRLWYAG